MNFEFIFLGGYGQFIWPAFIFSFLSCLILYKKSKKELIRQEKIFFKEYKKIHTVEIKTPERKKIIRESAFGSFI